MHNVPAAFGFLFILVVHVLEFLASLADFDEHAVGLVDVVVNDLGDQVAAVEIPATLGDDFVADLSDQRDQIGVRLILHRVALDQEDQVHDGHIHVFDLQNLVLVV